MTSLLRHSGLPFSLYCGLSNASLPYLPGRPTFMVTHTPPRLDLRGFCAALHYGLCDLPHTTIHTRTPPVTTTHHAAAQQHRCTRRTSFYPPFLIVLTLPHSAPWLMVWFAQRCLIRLSAIAAPSGSLHTTCCSLPPHAARPSPPASARACSCP